jgi:hypothetical protein
MQTSVNWRAAHDEFMTKIYFLMKLQAFEDLHSVTLHGCYFCPFSVDCN